MPGTESVIEGIRELLSAFETKVKSANRDNVTIYDLVAERLSMRLLNALWPDRWKLSLARDARQAGYDLLDAERSVYVQVTSDDSRRKVVEKTLGSRAFEGKRGSSLMVMYPLFSSVTHRPLRQDENPHGLDFAFDDKHVIDFDAIMGELSGLPLDDGSQHSLVAVRRIVEEETGCLPAYWDGPRVVMEEGDQLLDDWHVSRPELVSRIEEAERRFSLCILSGIAGSGKSELAREYAQANKGMRVCSIALPERIGEDEEYDLDEVLDGMELHAPGFGRDARHAVLREFIEAAGCDTLFVIDNLNKLSPSVLNLFVSRRHQVIATTRLSPELVGELYDGGCVVEVTTAGDQSGVRFARELFLRRASAAPDQFLNDSVDDLVQLLGCHPLLVGVAAAQVRRICHGAPLPIVNRLVQLLRDSEFGYLAYEGAPEARRGLAALPRVHTAVRGRRSENGRHVRQGREGTIVSLMGWLFRDAFPGILGPLEQQVLSILGLVPGEWVESGEVCALAGDVPGEGLIEAAIALDALTEGGVAMKRSLEGGQTMACVHPVVAEAIRTIGVLEGGDCSLFESRGEPFWSHVVANGIWNQTVAQDAMGATYPLSFTSSSKLDGALHALYERSYKRDVERRIINHLTAGEGLLDLSDRLVLSPATDLYARLRRDASLAIVRWNDGVSIHLVTEGGPECVLMNVMMGADAELRYKPAPWHQRTWPVEGERMGLEAALVRHWTVPGSSGHEYHLGSVCGVPVTNVGPMAFYCCDALESVDLGMAAHVAAGAFRQCRRLRRISVSADNTTFRVEDGALVRVADHALVALPSRARRGSYAVPDGILSVEAYAFWNCSALTKVDLNEVRFVGREAFNWCQALIKLEGMAVEAVRSMALANCAAVRNVRLGRLKHMGEMVFTGCKALRTINVTSGRYEVVDHALIDMEDGTLVALPARSGVSYYRVPDGVVTIAAGALMNSTSLTEVVLSDDTSVVRERAFCGCEKLASVRLARCGRVFAGCFEGCRMLSSLEVDEGNTRLTVVDGALIDTRRNSLIALPPRSAEAVGAYEVPDYVTAILPGAMSGCADLVSLSLPNVEAIGARGLRESGVVSLSAPRLRHVGMGAFWGCKRLREVYVDKANPCTEVRDGALVDKRAGKLIVVFPQHQGPGRYRVPDGVRETDDGAFQYCSWLTHVDLNGIEELGRSPFHACSSLALISVRGGGRYRVDGGMLIDVISRSVICCPPAAAPQSLSVPRDIVRVADNAFDSCRLLEEINLRDVVSVGKYAFASCVGLVRVLASDVRLIGSGAFYGCTGLKSIAMPRVELIPPRAFEGCSSLSHAEFPLVWSVRYKAFSKCSSLVHASFASHMDIDKQAFELCRSLVGIGTPVVEHIGSRAFFRCRELREFDLSRTRYLDNGAFEKCESLVEVDLSSAAHVGAGAFRGCAALLGTCGVGGRWSLDLPSATFVGKEAFRGCVGLQSFSASQIRGMGEGALRGCVSLVRVDLPMVEVIWDYLLRDCSALVELSAPKATRVGNGSLNGCGSIETVSLPNVSEVDRYAFCRCKRLLAVRTPKAVLIKSDAFRDCKRLQILECATGAVPDLALTGGCSTPQIVR